MSEITILETCRLRLRQWKAADLAPFAALTSNPQVMEFFLNPLDRDASDAMALHVWYRMSKPIRA